jgi:hypothetical protein
MTRPAGLSYVEFKIPQLLWQRGQGGICTSQNGTVGLNRFLQGHPDVETF